MLNIGHSPNPRPNRRRIPTAMFGILYLETIVLIWVLLSMLTHDEWPLSSVGIAYVFVAFVREPVDRWIASGTPVTTPSVTPAGV